MCARACLCYVNVTSTFHVLCDCTVHSGACVCLMYEICVNVCVALRRLLLPLSDVVPHTAVQFTVRAVVFLRASPFLCQHCCSPVWNPDTGAQKPPEPGSVGRYPTTPMTLSRPHHGPLTTPCSSLADSYDITRPPPFSCQSNLVYSFKTPLTNQWAAFSCHLRSISNQRCGFSFCVFKLCVCTFILRQGCWILHFGLVKAVVDPCYQSVVLWLAETRFLFISFAFCLFFSFHSVGFFSIYFCYPCPQHHVLSSLFLTSSCALPFQQQAVNTFPPFFLYL